MKAGRRAQSLVHQKQSWVAGKNTAHPYDIANTISGPNFSFSAIQQEELVNLVLKDNRFLKQHRALVACEVALNLRKRNEACAERVAESMIKTKVEQGGDVPQNFLRLLVTHHSANQQAWLARQVIAYTSMHFNHVFTIACETALSLHSNKDFDEAREIMQVLQTSHQYPRSLYNHVQLSSRYSLLHSYLTYYDAPESSEEEEDALEEEGGDSDEIDPSLQRQRTALLVLRSLLS